MESNFSFGNIKNIFKKDKKFTKKCTICGLKFSGPEKTKIHMMKAHTKPKSEKQNH